MANHFRDWLSEVWMGLCGCLGFAIFLVVPPGIALSEEADARAYLIPPGHQFVHPGLLHGGQDLARIREHVNSRSEPWSQGFERFRLHPASAAKYALQGPAATVVRDPRGSHDNQEMIMDGNAAYQNALMWCITGDESHAQKAVEILDAWSQKLEKLGGHDSQLAAGLNGFKFVNAAELIRATYPQWPLENQQRFSQMLTGVIYPPLKDFATFANGNWDGACMKTVLAIGIYCDDRKIANSALDYYVHGVGNGSLTHYVINETGQCQESGRDQQHTQLGLGQLAEVCEVAWHQSIDLYSLADNRLLKGFEYTSQYNLGEDVPFKPYTDLTGKLRSKVISPVGRGRLRPIYEMVLNHYQGRAHVLAPQTQRAAEKIRPEGAAFGADHPGFGTLLFTLDSQ